MVPISFNSIKEKVQARKMISRLYYRISFPGIIKKAQFIVALFFSFSFSGPFGGTPGFLGGSFSGSRGGLSGSFGLFGFLGGSFGFVSSLTYTAPLKVPPYNVIVLKIFKQKINTIKKTKIFLRLIIFSFDGCMLL
jgi:hypothetical protein